MLVPYFSFLRTKSLKTTCTMKSLSLMSVVGLAALIPMAISGRPNNHSWDFAADCYHEPLPNLPQSHDNRTVPWGTPSIKNGTFSCCDSLDDVRAGIDSVDAQILELLAQRAAFVREATRFKATASVVDVPSRDQQVILQAVQNATSVHLPQIIADAVFTAIINASVPFELCVFNSFQD